MELSNPHPPEGALVSKTSKEPTGLPTMAGGDYYMHIDRTAYMYIDRTAYMYIDRKAYMYIDRTAYYMIISLVCGAVVPSRMPECHPYPSHTGVGLTNEEMYRVRV